MLYAPDWTPVDREPVSFETDMVVYEESMDQSLPFTLFPGPGLFGRLGRAGLGDGFTHFGVGDGVLHLIIIQNTQLSVPQGSSHSLRYFGFRCDHLGAHFLNESFDCLSARASFLEDELPVILQAQHGNIVKLFRSGHKRVDPVHDV